ncbi:MAG TPA: SurA N-terminal domain-containing protein, partial [Alphaproteobacteria bacterium]|nr:SurA N-terminal domain-containing protein [Alphaproteobacteria bacterium]
MVMQSMRHGRFSGLIKFFFLVMLALGTLGLVLTDVSGTMTGGSVGGNNVAAVGGEKISLISFDRTVNRTLSRIGMSPQEAYQLGYLNQILQEQMRQQALQLAARDVGIEVGRDQIAKQAAKIVEPVAGEKGNKQEALEQILRAQGMTEGEFISQVGREAATALLVNAVSGALAEPSKALVEDLYMHENESRDVEMIVFPHADFTLEREVDEAALKTAYEGLKENFATAETRDIRILVLDDAALKDKVEISESDVRSVYDEDKNSFVVQETRKVEQVIIKDKDQATKIADSAKAGKSLKDATKEVTGDEKAYLGD